MMLLTSGFNPGIQNDCFNHKAILYYTQDIYETACLYVSCRDFQQIICIVWRGPLPMNKVSFLMSSQPLYVRQFLYHDVSKVKDVM